MLAEIRTQVMSQETITLITVLTGLVSVAAALGAAWAAHKSAVTAQSAARHVESVHRRGLIRDLVSFANGGIAEMTRISELIGQMKRGIKDLQHGGGSPDERVITRAEKKQQELVPLCEEAGKMIKDPLLLGETSEDDLMQELTKMEGFLSQARQVKDSLEKQVSSIEGEIPYMRDRLK